LPASGRQVGGSAALATPQWAAWYEMGLDWSKAAV
jgi:hypothetical protein